MVTPMRICMTAAPGPVHTQNMSETPPGPGSIINTVHGITRG